MSECSVPSDVSRYEQACDQAIAMCDGNLRSTIKALIMANEYLEAELEELQAALNAGAPERLPEARTARAKGNAA
jgi:chaperonin cofactor prefoldin